MLIEIQQPALKLLIAQQLATDAFDSVEDLLLQALRNTTRHPERAPERAPAPPRRRRSDDAPDAPDAPDPRVTIFPPSRGHDLIATMQAARNSPDYRPVELEPLLRHYYEFPS